MGLLAAPAGAATPLRLTLPAPTGPDRVGTVSLHLVDPSRTDPWVPDHPIREIMAQIWYPATDTARYPTAPWMTPLAAAHFEQVHGVPPDSVTLPSTVGHLDAPVDHRGGPHPVVLYSPGSHGDRTINTALVEDLASHGYVVVAMDHTHDSDEVEFPDGRLEVGTLPPDTLEINTEAVAVREADTRFVLDELAVLEHGGNPDHEHARLPRGLAGSLDLSRTGMFGWSIGGATAAATMRDDPRIRAGIDMDGTFYGPVVTDGLTRPFLLMSSQNHGRNNDPTWVSFWSHLTGWRLDLRLAGAAHGSYSDAEALIPEIAGVLGLTPEQVAQQVGTIDSRRAITDERVYVRAFFDLHLRHRDDHLLDGPSPCYPEVMFVP